MKKTCGLITLFTVLALSGPVFAEAPAPITALLKPFVEKHELAGAVALLADKDYVLSVEAVAFPGTARMLTGFSGTGRLSIMESKPLRQLILPRKVKDRMKAKL